MTSVFRLKLVNLLWILSADTKCSASTYLQCSAIYHYIVDTLDRSESIFRANICDIGTGTRPLEKTKTMDLSCSLTADLSISVAVCNIIITSHVRISSVTPELLLAVEGLTCEPAYDVLLLITTL